MRRDTSFTNWAGNQRGNVRAWESPADEAAVLRLFERATRENRRVRPVGSGHSWSDIAVPEDIAVDLRALSGVVRVDGDLVIVRAGTRLRDLNAALADKGLAMPILGSIAEQTLAGAVATATHGSSLRHGNLATLVTGMRVALPTGDVLVLREGDPELDGAAVHLGLLGIVTELTVRVTKRFTLEERKEPMSFKAFVDDIDDVARSAEFVKVWWLPSTGQVVVFRYERTTETPRHSPAFEWFDEQIVNRRVFDGLLKFAGRVPEATPLINRAVASTYLKASRRVADSVKAFNLAMPPTHREAEWSVPMGTAARALRDLDHLLRAQNLRVNFPCEVRFVKGDARWMSPAFGGDTCHIGVYQAESPDLATYFARTEELATSWKARPHWGKEFTWGKAALRAAYPRYNDFCALVRASDPLGILDGPFRRRLLGPTTP